MRISPDLRITAATVVALALGGCQEDPTFGAFAESYPRIQNEALPPLEDIPFEALGQGRIAFHRLWRAGDSSGVYLVDAAARSTSSHLGGSLIADPEVAPRGAGIAFAALTGGETFWDIYVTSLAGTSVRRVSESLGSSEGPPTWDPAGRDVLFMDARECCDVYVRSVTPSQGIAPIRHLLSPGTRMQLWPIPGMDIGLDSYIALTGISFLQILDPVGTTLSTVYEVEEGSGAEVRAPSWSPDGGSIAFLEVERQGDARTTRVLRLHVETGAVELLATVEAERVSLPALSREAYSSCWTDDGAILAFTTPVGSAENSLFAVPAGGGEPVRITSRPDVWDVSVSCF